MGATGTASWRSARSIRLLPDPGQRSERRLTASPRCCRARRRQWRHEAACRSRWRCRTVPVAEMRAAGDGSADEAEPFRRTWTAATPWRRPNPRWARCRPNRSKPRQSGGGRADARAGRRSRSPARARAEDRDADMRNPQADAGRRSAASSEPDEMAAAAEDSIVAGEIGELLPACAAGNGSWPRRKASRRLAADEVEEVEEPMRARRAHPTRHYKTRKSLNAGRSLLVQVAKEEAAAPRARRHLSVRSRALLRVVPNPAGGGVSRQTPAFPTSPAQGILEESTSGGMGHRPPPAPIGRSRDQRDYEYLLGCGTKSARPSIDRAGADLRGRQSDQAVDPDLYARDIDEVLVEGEEGYRRQGVHAHADPATPSGPALSRPASRAAPPFPGREPDRAIHSPVVQLRSGGYIVINQTRPLVASTSIRRSTRERNIEETALRTTSKRLRDARQLGCATCGPIVIDSST